MYDKLSEIQQEPATAQHSDGAGEGSSDDAGQVEPRPESPKVRAGGRHRPSGDTLKEAAAIVHPVDCPGDMIV
ncbi:hypothetical protein HYR54_04010 [Candidatus Acetothermia bacterium]|nr:hypothetical protein [Candidatus Acetothermia bacterium]